MKLKSNRFSLNQPRYDDDNVGTRLHDKGVHRQHLRQKTNNEIRQQLEAEQMKELTFQPKLVTAKYFQGSSNNNLKEYGQKIENGKQLNRDSSPKSNHGSNGWRHQLRSHNRSKSAAAINNANFSSNRSRSKNARADPSHHHQRLIQYGRDLQLRKEQEIQLAGLKQSQEFKFKPKINQKSRSMIREKRENLKKLQEQIGFAPVQGIMY